jgi:tRNA C32,U32 (ribose-2'-O)-methylase TrmJ
MSVLVVLHQPQDLVNIAHVVRVMKNFGFRDLRLVAPREYDAYRVEGIAHQTADVLARVKVVDTLDEALGDCVHVVGFTARGRTAKRRPKLRRRPRRDRRRCSSAARTRDCRTRRSTAAIAW